LWFGAEIEGNEPLLHANLRGGNRPPEAIGVPKRRQVGVEPTVVLSKGGIGKVHDWCRDLS
jgi:hypothetical protein